MSLREVAEAVELEVVARPLDRLAGGAAPPFLSRRSSTTPDRACSPADGRD